MTTIQTERPQAVYALGHTPEEYERLRAQARAWETATGRLLDQVGLGPSASCLHAGCGPGETMRLMAERVGPAGRVLGVDADAALGAMTLAILHGAGHRQCHFQAQDLAAGEPIPGAPFDLVYARLLLFHLPRRIEVLRRLWGAVAPGGHLLVQDYDLRSICTLPQLDWAGELLRVWTGAFGAAGADVSAGTRLPQLFAQAGVGTPDGTDVSRPHRAARHRPPHHGERLSELAAHGPDVIALSYRAARRRGTGLDRPRRRPLPRPPGAVAAADRRVEAQGAGMTAVIPPLRGPGRRRRAMTASPCPLDVHAIRRHFAFPALGRVVLNNAASSQPPTCWQPPPRWPFNSRPYVGDMLAEGRVFDAPSDPSGCQGIQTGERCG